MNVSQNFCMTTKEKNVLIMSCKTPCNYQRDNDTKLKTTFILSL